MQTRDSNKIRIGDTFDRWTVVVVGWSACNPATKNRFIRSLYYRSKFEHLKAEWIKSLGAVARIRDMVLLMPYQRIIGMGNHAIPYMIEDLRIEPLPWFWALEAVTGMNPAKNVDQSDTDAVIQAWLSWADSNPDLCQE